MIISHKHKFIFIKTRKTAGTSIEIALSKICGENDILTPISTEDELFRRSYSNKSAQNYKLPFSSYSRKDIISLLKEKKRKAFYNHMSSLEIRQNLPSEIWEHYFKFTIERNPFDKIVSLYFWRGGDRKFKSIYDFLTQGGLEDFNSFDQYAIEGSIAVDHIYQYEELEFMCNDLTNRFHLEEHLKLPQYRAKSKTRKIKNYKDVLDSKSIELISSLFSREIKMMNYTY